MTRAQTQQIYQIGHPRGPALNQWSSEHYSLEITWIYVVSVSRIHIPRPDRQLDFSNIQRQKQATMYCGLELFITSQMIQPINLEIWTAMVNTTLTQVKKSIIRKPNDPVGACLACHNQFN